MTHGPTRSLPLRSTRVGGPARVVGEESVLDVHDRRAQFASLDASVRRPRDETGPRQGAAAYLGWTRLVPPALIGVPDRRRWVVLKRRVTRESQPRLQRGFRRLSTFPAHRVLEPVIRHSVLSSGYRMGTKTPRPGADPARLIERGRPSLSSPNDSLLGRRRLRIIAPERGRRCPPTSRGRSPQSVRSEERRVGK